MKSKNTFTLLTALALSASAAFTTQAANIVSFNLYAGNTRNQMDPSADFAGAPGVRTTNWNQITASGLSFPAGTIQDNAGTYLPNMAMDLIPGASFTDRNPGNTNDGKVFQSVLDKFEGTPGSLVVSNIPYGNYNVYFYFLPDTGSGIANARGGYFTMTNSAGLVTRRYIKNQDASLNQLSPPANDGTGYVLANTTAIAASGSFTQIEGGNYVKFAGLTNSEFTVLMSALGDGSADDAGNIITDGETHKRLKWCGFQIEQVEIGVATNLSLAMPIPDLLQGNPATFTLQVNADFSDGTSADVTSAPGIGFTSLDTGVFTVSGVGVLQPLNAGVANLVIDYQSVSLTQAVTVLAPVSLSAPTVANTSLYSGNNAGDVTTATLLASFSGYSDVDVSAFNGTTFSGDPAGVVSVAADGTVTAVGPGTFSLVGNYGGLSATNSAAGTVTAFVAPGGVDAFSVNITDNNHPVNFKNLSGAPGARAAYWNNLPLIGTTASNEIVEPLDYQGNVLNGTVIQVSGHAAGGSFAINPLGSNDQTMFRTVYDAGINSPASYLDQSGMIVVSNVPYAKYDVYFYTWNDNGASGTNRSGYFRPLEQDKYYTRINDPSAPQNPSSDGSGYVEATPQVFNGALGDYPASLADVPKGNYIKVAGLTDPDLVVEWGATALDFFDDPADVATVARMRFSGFQVVKSLEGLAATNIYLQTPVGDLLPGDPGTFALTVLGDFSDGTTGGDIGGLPGLSFSSANSSVFTVTPQGVVQAGNTPGTANLIVNYQSVSYTQAVTTLAPSNVRVAVRPDTLYTDGVIASGTAQAMLVADFDGMAGVDITGFAGVSFSGPEPSIATVDSSGVVTPVATGRADVTGTYLGTPYTTVDAVNVTSISDAPVMKHRYSFRDTGSVIADSVGNADGTLFPPLGTNQPITLDGELAHFPGDAEYSTAPYISLPPGLVTERGDITIEMWVGLDQLKTWSRFFASGQTSKGTDPHNDGNGSGLSYLSVYASYSGEGVATLSYSVGSSAADLKMNNAFGTGTERHVVAVYAPHRGLSKLYVDGVLETSDVPSDALTGMIDDVVWLGVSRWNDSTLAGWFDELRIYEGAFSDTDVVTSMAAGPNAGLPTVNPELSVQKSGANLLISWPASATGYVLNSNAVLNGTWFPVGITPATNGENLEVTVPAGPDNAFFILQE